MSPIDSPAPFLCRSVLEIELRNEFEQPLASLVLRGAELSVSLRKSAGRRVLSEAQLQRIALSHRPQRMVQEVACLNAELQLHRFLDLEVLEKPQIRIEERGPVNGRKNRRAVLPHLSGQREATAVDVLMR